MAALSEEQTLIKNQAHAWVSEKAPVQQFRAMRDAGTVNGFAADTWQQMTALGWPGLLVPEQFGGAALGHFTFGLILEEIGRQLTASPLFASAYVGATALVLGDNAAQQQALLPKIVDGSAIVTLALDEGPRHTPNTIACTARATGDTFQIDGAKTFVMEGSAATHFVVATRTSGNVDDAAGITLLLVPADANGVTRTPLSTVDSRGYANLAFDGVSVDASNLLGKVDGGSALLGKVLDRAAAGISAEMLGTASQAFDMTIDYLKTRKQFGQLIGSFQALGHRAAELFTEMELTRSCVEAALQGIDADADDVAQLASLAKCKAGSFLHRMTNEMIQMHGGIGMTDEFDAGLYLKRARALESAFGNQAYHRDRYARLLDF